MKRLLLTLSLFSLVGCQNSDMNDGYAAGYELTCGFSSSAGNKLVIEKQFAYNFLAGAKACAQEYPERARQVLGLASADRAVSAREANEEMVPEAEEQTEQLKLPDSAPLETETAEAASRAVKAPIQAKAPAQSKAPVQAKIPAKIKAPAKAKSPAKAKAPAQAKAPTKTKAPGQIKAPVQTKAPVEDRAPINTANAPAKEKETNPSRPREGTHSVPAKSRQHTKQKKELTSYELFMGE